MAALLSKGTKNYTAAQFAETLEDNGIKIVPAVTPDAFQITALTTKKEYKKTLEMLNEVINNAVFADTELEKARSEKLHNIKRSRDVPMNIAVEEYKALIYGDSQYNNSNKLLEKTLPQITRGDITEYYEKTFAPNNVVVSINGNLDAAQAREDFNKIFHGQGQTFNFSDYKIPALATTKTSVRTIKDAETNWIIFGWQAPELAGADYAAMEIIDAILGSGMSSRLFKRLRVEGGLAYQVGSQYGANVLRGSFITYIGTNPKNLELAQRRLLEEVFRFKTEPVSEKELADAKEKLIGQFIVSQETNLQKASTVGWFEASGKDFSAEKYERLINAVTAADITAAANKYFTYNYVLSVVR